MRREIRLIAYNRPEHTRQCVDHLLRCRGLEAWRVVASVDGLPGGGNNPGVVAELQRIPGVDLRLRERHGLNNHMHKNWSEFLTEGSAALLHVEDDILLAPDALTFCERHEWALMPVGPYPSITLLGTRITSAQEARLYCNEVSETPFLFCCYGVYLMRSVVERIMQHWCTGWASWDCGITNWYQVWRWITLYPVVPRSRNIGYPPGSRLAIDVERPIWSGDLEALP